MAANPSGNQDRYPTDELGNELRGAVEGILGDEPPEDLMQRTLDAVRAQKPKVARSNRPWLALVGALVAAAACIAVLALVWQCQDGDRQIAAPGGEPPDTPVLGDPGNQLPTLWAYRRASLDSPEALDALLDEHAARLLPSDPTSLRMGGFSGSGPEVL